MFTDVPKDHWAYQAVRDLHRRGIVIGYPAAARRTIPSENAMYAQGTPKDTWTSFVRAMKNGDETAMERLISQECFTSNSASTFKFKAAAPDLTSRLKVYSRRAKEWGKRVLVLDDPRNAVPEAAWIHATLIDVEAGPDLFDMWIKVEMIRVGKLWYISAIHLG